LGHGPRIVLQQLVVGWQTQIMQRRQRCATQQGRKPTVKRANLHRPATFQQGVVQVAQGIQLLGCGLPAKTPVVQFLTEFSITLGGELQQPLVKTLAHLACGFLGKGNGQNLVRRAALQQGPHNARHQHPGLARTSASLNRHATPGVTGNGVETAALHRRTVVFKGSYFRHAGSLQKSLRQRPRAWQ
jgi:hypothetical protein